LQTLLTATEAAEFLRCSKGQVYRMAERGEIPHVRIGSMVRFTLDDLTDWIAQRRVGVETQ